MPMSPPTERLGWRRLNENARNTNISATPSTFTDMVMPEERFAPKSFCTRPVSKMITSSVTISVASQVILSLPVSRITSTDASEEAAIRAMDPEAGNIRYPAGGEPVIVTLNRKEGGEE